MTIPRLSVVFAVCALSCGDDTTGTGASSTGGGGNPADGGGGSTAGYELARAVR